MFETDFEYSGLPGNGTLASGDMTLQLTFDFADGHDTQCIISEDYSRATPTPTQS